MDRNSEINRDRHIHLEGSISTMAIRKIVRSIIPMMNNDEQREFWHLLAYHQNKTKEHGRIRTEYLQRYKNINEKK